MTETSPGTSPGTTPGVSSGDPTAGRLTLDRLELGSAPSARPPASSGGGAVRLTGLAKAYDGVPAVTGIDLDVAGGEFFSLLGASGCGKTTTLRMIAGFEKPDAGEILIDGRDVAFDPPHVRPVNTVFQNYALFPHLSVADNVGFGLRYQQASKAETRERIGRALELTRMGGFAKRRPGQLSGGQQQRVALARALVLNPKVLLLDEPLGALDAQLRKSLQLELRGLQREVGITFVYVTHDQEEALTMSDRIAVLADGAVEQVGTPEQVYAEPATRYVAGFIGHANIVDAALIPGLTGEGVAVIRPERFWLHAEGSELPAGRAVLPGVVADVVYLGSATHVQVTLADGTPITVEVANQGGPRSVPHLPGERVLCGVDPDAVRVLPA